MTDFVYIFGPPFTDSEISRPICLEGGGHEYLDFVKIGTTSIPKENLRALLRGNPRFCYWALVWVWDKGLRVEQQLHHIFKAWRERGEWFWLSRADVEFIEQIDRDRNDSLYWDYQDLKLPQRLPSMCSECRQRKRTPLSQHDIHTLMLM